MKKTLPKSCYKAKVSLGNEASWVWSQFMKPTFCFSVYFPVYKNDFCIKFEKESATFKFISMSLLHTEKLGLNKIGKNIIQLSHFVYDRWGRG